MSKPTRREQILCFIREYCQGSGFPPTYREIAAAVHLSSTSTIRYHLEILEAEGALELHSNVARGIRLK